MLVVVQERTGTSAAAVVARLEVVRIASGAAIGERAADLSLRVEVESVQALAANALRQWRAAWR